MLSDWHSWPTTVPTRSPKLEHSVYYIRIIDVLRKTNCFNKSENCKRRLDGKRMSIYDIYIYVASLWRILTMRRSKSVIPRCAGTAGRCLSCDGTWYSWLTGSQVQTWFQEGAVGSQEVSIIHAYFHEHVALHHSKTAYANHSTNCMELPAHRRSCTREAQRQNCLLPGKTNAKRCAAPAAWHKDLGEPPAFLYNQSIKTTKKSTQVYN